MSAVLTAGFWLAAFQIIAVNLLLSGDNAIVIALACRKLPDRQRRIAMFWGVFGAVAARVVLTYFAIRLLSVPWLKIVGAAMLVWIGVQLILEDTDKDHDVRASERLWIAIWTVVVADIVMSVDNVVGVAAAAHDSFGMLVFGLVMSIPIVVFGSTLVLKLIQRFPAVVIAGGGMLGYIAGGLAVRDPAAAGFVAEHGFLAQALPYAGFLLVVAAGLLVTRLRRGQDARP